MSRYCTVKTEFKDDEALVQALMETGKWTAAQIEVHQNPKHLFGYKGDRREETAHIIIRRKHVGNVSNDIGFVKAEDGSCEAIISKYDKSRFNDQWMARLKGSYAYHTIKRQQERCGRQVARTRCPNTGRQRVEVTGYR